VPPDEGSDHELGPIRLDPLTNQYVATCACGERIGPVLNAGMVHAAFDAHVRRATDTPPAS
jgi:hypothetical protein